MYNTKVAKATTTKIRIEMVAQEASNAILQQCICTPQTAMDIEIETVIGMRQQAHNT